MNGDAVHFAMREWQRVRPVMTEAMLVLAVAALAALLGPFGTFTDLSLAERSAYWFGIIAANWLQVRLCLYLLGRVLGPDRFLLTAVAAALLASLPASLEVIWLESLFRPQVLPQRSFLTLYSQVAVLTVAVTVPVSRFLRPSAAGPAPAAGTVAPPGEDGDPPAASLLKRLPERLGGTIHCLQAEDHYVRVHTPNGSELLLLRFSDAVGEMRGIEGMQVHRSWWIARAAVDNVVRRQRKVYLRLRNGLEVPVSRRFLAGLREAGWL